MTWSMDETQETKKFTEFGEDADFHGIKHVVRAENGMVSLIIYICVINKLQKCRMHFTTIICHNGYMMSMSHSYAMTTVGLDKTLNIITYKDGERTQTNNK